MLWGFKHMAFKLEEPYNLPYYLQLKNIMKSKIQSGAIKSNKLPPVRQVARIPADDTIGIVTTSLQFKKEIREVLQKLNLAFSGILETNSHNNKTVKEIVRKCDTVLVSPKQKSVVLSHARNGTKVIEFVFTPDRTSINNLKLAILELKKGMI